MSRRLATPDTPADVELRKVLDAQPRGGFVVIAGAGSGKTTSLVKALDHIVRTHGEDLRARGQQIACVTYTEVAAREIHEDIGETALAQVSTIHSFLWRLVKPFQADIRAWVEARIEEKIEQAKQSRNAFTSRTRASTRAATDDRIARYERQLSELPGVSTFSYGVGSSYVDGVLGHADIQAMVPALIMARPLLARLTATKYPYIFVDESQDTFPEVVECLKHVADKASGAVSLGFFGDPMQQIYMTGVGAIAIEDGWAEITKPENFRSADKVLAVINAVRAEADGLQQVPGLAEEDRREGETHFFVLPANDERNENLERVRTWLTDNGAAGDWTSDAAGEGAKVLMIVHRMAARRLKFLNLFEAFDRCSLKDAFSEGRAWPLTPFRDVIRPLIADGDSVVRTLRAESRVLSDSSLGGMSVSAALAASRKGLGELREIMTSAGPGSIGAALRSAAESGLVDLDPRWTAYLSPNDARGTVLPDDVRAALDAFMECDVSELAGYFEYIEQRSPYATQHGTKGAEFARVVVVLDDDEGRFNLYSYEKLLGMRELSGTDIGHVNAGNESVLDRTRRLLYVCVSRAEDALAVVLFAADVDAAVAALQASGITAGEPIRTLDRI